ncbi:hypothetical protein KY285_000834 [Solanum tuberosum]|nr:hypothetical protein KY285_000834 [Solanum tuberosum]
MLIAWSSLAGAVDGRRATGARRGERQEEGDRRRAAGGGRREEGDGRRVTGGGWREEGDERRVAGGGRREMSFQN